MVFLAIIPCFIYLAPGVLIVKKYFGIIIWHVINDFVLMYFFSPNLSPLSLETLVTCLKNHFVLSHWMLRLYFFFFNLLCTLLLDIFYLSFFKFTFFYFAIFNLLLISSSELFLLRYCFSVMEFPFGSSIICICLLGFATCYLIMSMFHLNYGNSL